MALHPTASLARGCRRAALAAGLAAGLLLALVPARSATQRFYSDDPIAVEPETADASKAAEWEIDLAANLLINSFHVPADIRPVRAQNVNTIDEVPDSGWFTNRIYAHPMTRDELVRGPNSGDAPAPGRWTVIRPKSSGVAPGFTVRDERGIVWFVSFDAKGYPGAATGAIAVAVRLFWALGYHQVESFIASTKLEALAVDPAATIHTQGPHRRKMTMHDVELVLKRADRAADGSYRVLAARAIPGRVLGGFRYEGTRPDDPNDLVPHEHRRELRALQVFGAWTNLVDIKAGNTLDTVIEQGGRGVIRHYLQDVGSTFGTGAEGPHEWEEGWEHLVDKPPMWQRLRSFGFARQPWQKAKYTELPAIGRFEGDVFSPQQWKSRVPAGALLNARGDDTFWAALRVAAFSDEMIRAVAETARYADPAATRLLGDVLIKRRDKIAAAYLPAVNPLVGFGLDGNGVLTFENAAVARGVAKPPAGGYRVTWSRFDNATGTSTSLGADTRSEQTRVTAPAALPRTAGSFIQVAVSATDPARPAWSVPVQLYFRFADNAWKLVGLERLP